MNECKWVFPCVDQINEAIFSNDQKLLKYFEVSGENCGERCWARCVAIIIWLRWWWCILHRRCGDGLCCWDLKVDGDDHDDGDIEVTCVKDREMRGWLLGGGGDVCWRGGCRSVGSQPSFSSGNNASDTGNTQRNDDLTNKLNTEHNLHCSVLSEMSVAVTCQILQRCDLTVRGQVGGGLWTHRGRKGQVVAASSSRWLRF